MATTNPISTLEQRIELNKVYAEKLTVYVKEHFGQEYFVSSETMSYDIMSISFEYKDVLDNKPKYCSVSIYLFDYDFNWDWKLSPSPKSFNSIKLNYAYKTKYYTYYSLMGMILADNGGFEAIAKEYAEKYVKLMAQENPVLYGYFTSKD